MWFPTSWLVAYWKADESSWNMADSIWWFTLTNNNTATFTTWKINNWASLNGTTQYFSSTSDLWLWWSSQNFSFSMWIKPSSTIIAQQVFINHTDGNNHNDIQIDWFSWNVRFIRTRLWIASDVASGTQTFIWGTWYHLVVTYDGTTLKWYVNNWTAVTVASSWNWSSWWADGIAIWALRWWWTYFWGIIDEIGAWNRALSSTEVSDLYNWGSWISYSGITGAFLQFFL